MDPGYLGLAGVDQPGSMGVYRLTEETHNNKPVWSRHDGTKKLFFDNGEFYCDNCIITNNDITGGHWKIGPDPATDRGNVMTEDPAGNLWPHQVSSWKYINNIYEFETESELTVTGNINIILILINII